MLREDLDRDFEVDLESHSEIYQPNNQINDLGIGRGSQWGDGFYG